MSQVVSDQLNEFASPTIRDSRRLMGPNRFADDPGAVIDVEFAPEELALADEFVLAWRDAAVALGRPLGWSVTPMWRRSPNGASCFVRIPVDALMTGTELNEQAWVRAEATVRARQGLAVEPLPDVADAAIALGIMADEERAPFLADLVREARDHGITVLLENESVTLGTGASARTWSLDAVPDPHGIAWLEYDRIPIVLVTGSNGKTTTVRMLAAVLREAVGAVAMSSTTGVYVDGEQLDGGDYSGPGGARLALRDPRSRAAVLETARGGLLRRGLAMYEADVAVVTNVAADHFGDYGVHDIEALAEVKLTLARAVRTNGTLVLNADDATLRALGPSTGARIVWFSMDPLNPLVQVTTLAASDVLASQALAEAAAAGVAPPREGQLWRAAEAWTVVNDQLVRRSAAGDEPVVGVHELASAFNGAARVNVANALAAGAAASALGVPMSIAGAALAAFGSKPEDNPGRLERHRVNGVEVVVDYAHNAAAMTALLEATASIPARRRIVVVGTAGDRTDEALRALARAAWNTVPVEFVVVKELERLSRGRVPGALAAVVTDELARSGASAAQVMVVADDLAALEVVLGWVRAGDLAVVTVHERGTDLRERLATRPPA
jgi:UDP-N-acetylmuramyl tripeptide synthase